MRLGGAELGGDPDCWGRVQGTIDWIERAAAPVNTLPHPVTVNALPHPIGEKFLPMSLSRILRLGNLASAQRSSYPTSRIHFSLVGFNNGYNNGYHTDYNRKLMQMGNEKHGIQK